MTHAVPLPVQVGSRPPEEWDKIEAQQQHEDASPYLMDQRRPAIADPNLPWSELGFEPRWISFDSAACVAALQPSIFASEGADEFSRFRQGAKQRGEVALVISPIGTSSGNASQVFNIFGPLTEPVSIDESNTTIVGKPIGKGAKIKASDNLGHADGQLALLLLNQRASHSWHSLSLHGMEEHHFDGIEYHSPEGTLIPILETDLGEPVVAAWVRPDVSERRYVIPRSAPWATILQWLAEEALPEFVPGALRRARSPLAVDENLQTLRERAATAALTQLDSEYASRRASVEREVAAARSAAGDIREGLLYGTGQQLVRAVQAVLETAGLEVVDLDRTLGGTKNADLLCTLGARSRLIEVKSATGRASERAYQDLLRHLREWPSLDESIPVEGGVLIMSAQLRTAPAERSPEPYTRPEFLAAQTEPVVTALSLLKAWLDDDAAAIKSMLFRIEPGPVEAHEESKSVDIEHAPEPSRPPRRWFRRK
ncbi:hypothetical protein AAEP80_07050 [Curtobacterium sp. L3-7]|uniref:hypothetical protein n=1 Tax=Curtobacterium sp. L3-7 TaxID=3138787 RepID=UPI003B523354